MRKSDRQVEAVSEPTRRAVLAGAGVAGASALLAGCGWDTANLKDRYIADGQASGAPANAPAAMAPAESLLKCDGAKLVSAEPAPFSFVPNHLQPRNITYLPSLCVPSVRKRLDTVEAYRAITPRIFLARR